MARVVLGAAAAAVSVAVAAAAPSSFTHPGVLVSRADLSATASSIAAKSGPRYAAFLKATASPYGTASPVAPRGPPAGGVIDCGSYSKPDNGCSDEDADAATAYTQAVLFAVTGDAGHASNARILLDRYAKNLKSYTNSNAPLQAAWGASKWTRAAEVLVSTPGSGWPAASAAAFSDMLYAVSLPHLIAGSPDNGNWELSMIEAMMGLAVLSNNGTLFDHAVGFFRARLPAYVYTTGDGGKPQPAPRGDPGWYGQTVFNASVDGVAQETCRDLGHTQYGLAGLANAAATAAIQGVDLFGDAADRLVPSLEFHSGFLLGPGGGGDAPPKYMCGGAGVKIEYLPTFEVAFAAYSRGGANASALPLTAKHLATQVRASSGVDPHMMVFETLTHGADIPAGAW
jgi:hypothetical protein